MKFLGGTNDGGTKGLPVTGAFLPVTAAFILNQMLKYFTYL